MSDAVATSAAELLGGAPPAKKQRPPWPAGVPLVETYPGSKMYRHPVDKAYIKPADAVALGAPPLSTAPAPAPQPQPEPEPAPAPEPTPQPQPQPEPQPGNPKNDGPDFSNLPPGDGTAPKPGEQQQQRQQKEPTPEEIRSAYANMAGMFWDTIIRLLAAMLGDFWLPRTPEERKMVIDAFVLYFDSVAALALTPLQNLWVAISCYCVPRTPATVTKIVQWFKAKKQRRGQTAPNARTEKTPDGQPHNFSGVNVDHEPINVEAEYVRGPGI